MAKSKGFGKAIKALKDEEKRLTQLKSKLAKFNGKYQFNMPSVSFKVGGYKDVLSFFDEYPKAALKAHDLTMARLAIDLKAALDEAMNAMVWDWNGETRDIVDTGALRDSGKVIYDRSKKTLSINYDEEYAAIVHFGGVITSGLNPDVAIVYPARPWITAVLEGGYSVERFNFELVYSNYFIDYLAKELR